MGLLPLVDCSCKILTSGVKPRLPRSINLSTNLMIVIIRQGRWPLISAPQNIDQAWELADRLTQETGFAHWVGKA